MQAKTCLDEAFECGGKGGDGGCFVSTIDSCCRFAHGVVFVVVACYVMRVSCCAGVDTGSREVILAEEGGAGWGTGRPG